MLWPMEQSLYNGSTLSPICSLSCAPTEQHHQGIDFGECMRGLEEALGSYDDQRRGWLQELQIDQSISVAKKLISGRTAGSKHGILLSRNIRICNLRNVSYYNQILIAHHCTRN